MKSLRITLACALAAALLAGLCACAAADGLTDELNRPVPFGIAHADSSAGIRVYRSVTARSASDQLSDYQVCAILESLASNKVQWYRIRYVSGGAVKEGWLREDGFYPLTVAGLITVASDAASSAALKTLAGDANVFTAQATPAVTATPKPTRKTAATPTLTPKAPRRATATPAPVRKRYVLNTKTLKFHLPGCADAEKTAPENKKTTVTTRQSLISQGYTPCQKCDP